MSELASPTPPAPLPQGPVWDPTPPGRPPYGGWSPASPPGQQPQPGWSPAPPSDRRSARSGGRRGLLGSLVALLAGAGKYGVALLKLGKLGPTMISMVLSLGALMLLYGPAFGAGLLVLIAVHETGHLVFARAEGIRAGLPVFLGPLGAVIGIRQPMRDVRQEAVIAIGGPVVGTAGALVVYLAGMALPPGHLHGLLIAVAYFGFFLNLFNLVPMTPLDGGRVASALTRWANVVGIAVVAVLVVVFAAAGTLNPFLVVILLLGILSTAQRFRRERTMPRYTAIAPRTRLWIGLAYLFMLAVTALGMTIAHGQLPVNVA